MQQVKDQVMNAAMDPQLQEILLQRKQSMACFTEGYEPVNMYALVRADLEMNAGKMSAQVSHGMSQLARECESGVWQEYVGSGHGTKIIMQVKGLVQLMGVAKKLKEQNIPFTYVVDRGHVMLPHFDGNPIATAIVFGPVKKASVKRILNVASEVK